MSESQTALIAAVVSGLISVAGALLSNHYQSYKRKKREKREGISEWFDNVTYTSRQIKNKSLMISGTTSLAVENGRIQHEDSDKPVQDVLIYLEELEDLMADPPPDATETETLSRVQKIVGRYQNPAGGQNSIESSVDLKEFLYEQSHLLEQDAEDEKTQLLTKNRGLFSNILGR